MSLKSKLAVLGTLVSSSLFQASTTFAADPCSQSGLTADAKKALGCTGSTTELPTSIKTILQTVIGVAGIVAVVFVIVGGVQYLTSAGDPGKTEKAKKTIIYALIGLVICALAFAIVQFTIGGILGQ